MDSHLTITSLFNQQLVSILKRKMMQNSFFQIAFSWLIMLLSTGAMSQGDTPGDQVLRFDQFMQIVMQHHPVALQGDLQPQFGEANLRTARGAFEPKAFGDLNQKYFDGSNYYSLLDAGLKVPTWFGIEVKSGFEQNRGSYLNPENRNPENGLWYAGIALPLGQGLFIDERRAELKKARLFLEGSDVQRRFILNELQYEASKAYWSWFNAYHSAQVMLEGEDLARVRFEAVVRSAELGDRPFIDTLEASIQLQQRQQQLLQAQLDLLNAKALIAVFLWADGIIPLELEENTIPEAAEERLINSEENLPKRNGSNETIKLSELDSLIMEHPQLLLGGLKIETLEVEARLKREMLKPSLDLQYNALSQPIGGDPFTAYSVNNYKWGVHFSMPLFIRKERGALALAELKISDSKLDLEMKRAELKFKATSALNTWQNTRSQFQLYNRTANDYRSLLQAEQQLFNGGESSLFMVNARETAYINAQLKVIEIMEKNKKALAEVKYAFAFGDL
jgi:outer membrane protein TolC